MLVLIAGITGNVGQHAARAGRLCRRKDDGSYE